MTKIQIEYFLSLAAHKNMTRAAKLLNVTQPAFSKQISALEKDLGFILFARFKNGVELTPQGRIFQELFSSFEKQLKKGVEKANQLTKNAMDPIIVGYMEGWRADGFICEILDQFKKIHPDIPVVIHQLNVRDLMNGLHVGNIDAVFIHPDMVDEQSTFHTKPVYKSKIAIMLPRTLSDSLDFSFRRLENEPLIIISDEKNRKFIGYINLVHTVLGFKPSKVITADTEESLFFMVESGAGYALVCDISHTYGNPLHNYYIDTNYFREVVMIHKNNPSPGCSLLLRAIDHIPHDS